jgi:hypothetical protein
MNAKLALSAAFAALLVLPLVAADSHGYTGPLATENCAGGLSTGSACFKVPAGATTVAPAITDNVFGQEAGSFAFHLKSGGTLESGFFCPGDSLAIPDGAGTLTVDVTDPASASQTCGTLGAGTTGTISVAWS